LTFDRSIAKVQNNSAPGDEPRGANSVSYARRPQNHRQSLGFRFQSVKPTCRRPAERITMAAGGYSHHGIALRSDKAGEGSGRGRKATGHTRLRHRCVLKAKPSFLHGMARLAHQPRSASEPRVLTLIYQIKNMGFTKKCRPELSGRFWGCLLHSERAA
jgi:hypothetical protein